MERPIKAICTVVSLLPFLFGATGALGQESEKVRLLMNWFPQANQSGFWQAQIDNPERADGIDIQVLKGGPRIQVIPQVAVGQAEFGLADADDLLIARQNGAPVKAVFVGLDYVPYTLVYHPNRGINSIEDLSGKIVAVALGASYWEWVKHTYRLQGVREIPLSGDLGLFANTPDMVQQGYSMFLPPRIDEAGIPYEQFKIVDLGYRPYSILLTTDRMIQTKPNVVRKAVEAVQLGWQKFMADAGPSTHLMLPQNKIISPATHEQAVDIIKADFLPEDPARVGCMYPGRWLELANQMKAIDALSSDFDPSDAYDTTFLKGC
jgi:NitT/TauT family transport system substrate-binding protein